MLFVFFFLSSDLYLIAPSESLLMTEKTIVFTQQKYKELQKDFKKESLFKQAKQPLVHFYTDMEQAKQDKTLLEMNKNRLKNVAEFQFTGSPWATDYRIGE